MAQRSQKKDKSFLSHGNLGYTTNSSRQLRGKKAPIFSCLDISLIPLPFIYGPQIEVAIPVPSVRCPLCTRDWGLYSFYLHYLSLMGHLLTSSYQLISLSATYGYLNEVWIPSLSTTCSLWTIYWSLHAQCSHDPLLADHLWAHYKKFCKFKSAWIRWTLLVVFQRPSHIASLSYILVISNWEYFALAFSFWLGARVSMYDHTGVVFCIQCVKRFHMHDSHAHKQMYTKQVIVQN